MYNQLVAEATFVDNYLDSVENLPDDIARHMSRIRNIDIEYRGHLRDVDHYYDLFKSLENNNELTATIRRNRAVARISRSLIQAKELGDEKMHIVQMLTEMIEQKTRQLDADQKNLDIKEELQSQHRITDHHLMQAIDDLNTSGGGGGGGGGALTSTTPAPLANGNGSAGGSSGGGGGSSPNSERSAGNSNHHRLTIGNATNCNSVGNVNIGASGETHRTAIKRSRRRNENSIGNGSGMVSSNIELCGNESNSANEAAGTSNIERKNSNASNLQKKNLSQNQSNAGTAAGSGGGSGGGGTAASIGGVGGNNVNNNTSGSGGGSTAGKKKKRRARGSGAVGQLSSSAATRDVTPPPEPIDPDEPTYCVCNQISFGEMILCDNDLCPIEWFHFSCVSLVLKPKGKWFCPNCRGDRPNVMKPKSQFLKELERYNKEKEEKT